MQGPYPLEAFKELLNGRVEGSTTSNPRISPILRHNHGGLLSRLSNTFAPEPIDFDALTQGCAQLRALRETPGKINEPIWKACLGVLAFAHGGREIAHAWCDNDAEYGPAIDSKFNRSAQLSGPTTCAHFQSLNPAGCTGCRFGKSTPLEAARELRAQRAREPNTKSPRAVQPHRDKDDDRLGGDDVPATPISGNLTYQFRDGGALCEISEKPNKNGTDGENLTKITSFKLYIASLHRGEIRQAETHYLLRHFKPHAGWQTIDILASKLLGPTGIGLLADAGINIHDGEAFRRFARASVDHLTNQEKDRMQFEQFGWKDGNKSFLYGDKLYTLNGPIDAACAGELRYRAQWLQPKPGGSVDGWKQAVDCLMGAGSEGMSFTVLASFAAPLMRFQEDNEGGAIISLQTKASGTGKTTSLAGAYTVWSSSDRGLGLTSIDTKVSKGVTLGALGNLPVVYDEFSNKDPILVREFVMLFTSGRDKMRADSSGQIIHAAASWQTILFTATNQSMVEALMSTGESEAPALRVLEFPVESSGNLTLSEAARLKRQMEDNAGHAGAAFLDYLMEPGVLDWVQGKLRDLTDEIFTAGGFQKEHRFWVRALAATAAAAMIVEKLDLISFSPERIIGWAVKHFAAQVSGFGNHRTSNMPMIARFLDQHVGETLVMPGPARQGRIDEPPIGDVPKTRVTVRIEVAGDKIYILEEALRSWMAKHGGGYADLLNEMRGNGVLLSARKMVTLSQGTRLRSGQVKTVEMDASHPALTGQIREVLGGTVEDIRRNMPRGVKAR